MKQTSSLTRNLADAQERMSGKKTETVLFSLYTEDRPNLVQLIARYFDGATIYSAHGIWKGAIEKTTVIEIVGTFANLQRIFDLAGDIRVLNNQGSVLVTWRPVSRFDVTEASINHAAL